VASILVDHWLCSEGIQKSPALDFAKILGAILLSREVSENEFYRIRKRIPKDAICGLAETLKAEYERLVIEDGIRANDRVPEKEEGGEMF